jgi:benzylsuccinate CoA-transferase BbsE subunit
MRERGAELGALAQADWKTWDPTKADQAEVDAIEAPVLAFFAGLTKREFLTEGHRREMLGYPVSTVADIASDPQLEARGFFQRVAGSQARFCGSFAVIDGERPPLRHRPGALFDAEPSLISPPAAVALVAGTDKAAQAAAVRAPQQRGRARRRRP